MPISAVTISAVPISAVQVLDIGDGAKGRLLALTPATYIGLANELVDYLR